LGKYGRTHHTSCLPNKLLFGFDLKVTVCDAPVLPVVVECVSCSVLSSPHHISYSSPVILSGQCGQCDDQAQVIILINALRLHVNCVFTDNKTYGIIRIHAYVFSQYEWRAEDQGGVTLDLNEASTSTGRRSPNLVMRSGVLQAGQSYTFTLNVSQPDRGLWGSASLTTRPNKPPHGGLCDLSPESDIRLLETVVTYSCSGNTLVFLKV